VAHPPSPCAGTLSFTDVLGNPIGTTSTVSLSAAQGAFLDLPGQSVIPTAGRGMEVMPVFTPSPTVADGCIAGVEVFDQSSGYTRTLIPPGPPVLPAEP
jgi:hypothetical protein